MKGWLFYRIPPFYKIAHGHFRAISEMSQQRADLLEKIAVLDEIRKKEHDKKSDTQLGIIAGNLLGRDEPIRRKFCLNY